MANYKTTTDIDEIVSYINDARVVGFDYETSPIDKYRENKKAALHPRMSVIVGCSFSNKVETGIYVPVRHRGYKNIDEIAFNKILTDFLTDKEKVKVAHNLPFESMFSYANNIVIQPPVYDTIAAAQLTLKNAHEFYSLKDSGLKTLAKTVLGTELPTYEEVTGDKWFDELDPYDAETTRYGCADSDFALRLYHYFNGWFDRNLPMHRFICERVESPTSIYVGMMKYNGVPVDKEKLDAAKLKGENDIEKLANDIKFIIGDVNIGKNASTDAFKKYLFETLKLPILKKTEAGKPALDDEAIAMLKLYAKNKSLHDIEKLCDLVLSYRKVGKILTTYIDGWLKYMDKDTLCVYPEFLQLSTDTGRFACDHPNIQNCPQADNDPLKIRSNIKPPDGYKVMELDYSQAEIRIGAYYSNDKVLLDAYKNGIDVHAKTTSSIFHISMEEAHDKNVSHYKRRRTIAKTTLFGTFYGQTGTGLQSNLFTNAGLNLTVDECNTFIKELLNAYRGFAAWQQEIKRYARWHSYVKTALGRQRPLPDIMSNNYKLKMSAERMAMNTPIQGLCADLLKLSMGRIVVALRNRPYIKPIFTVHDSLVFIVKDDKVEEAAQIIKEKMEEMPPLKNFIGLIADVAVGPNYGELKDV